VTCLVVSLLEAWVNVVQGGSRVLPFAENRATFGIMQDDVKFVGLVRKSTFTEENIGSLLAMNFPGNTDGLAVGHVRGK
jgi:hypothetical protein